MRIIEHPETISKAMPIFLGGSTAKGDWQRDLQDFVADTSMVVINTCRPDWDKKEPQYMEKNSHIFWEFEWMQRTKNFFICIPEDAKSPTVLLELGIVLAQPLAKAVIYIHPKYSHFNNAEIAARVFGHHVYTDFYSALEKLKDMYQSSAFF